MSSNKSQCKTDPIHNCSHVNTAGHTVNDAFHVPNPVDAVVADNSQALTHTLDPSGSGLAAVLHGDVDVSNYVVDNNDGDEAAALAAGEEATTAALAAAAAEEAVNAVLMKTEDEEMDEVHEIAAQAEGVTSTQDGVALAAAAAAVAVQGVVPAEHGGGLGVIMDQALLATAAAAAASSTAFNQHNPEVAPAGIPRVTMLAFPPPSNPTPDVTPDVTPKKCDNPEDRHDALLAARRLKDRRRYATMTPEQREQYNAHRRELYHKQGEGQRKRRRERERARYHSLEGEARRARNARRAKLERDRYNKLSPEELAARNMKRRERARMKKLEAKMLALIQMAKDAKVEGNGDMEEAIAAAIASASDDRGNTATGAENVTEQSIVETIPATQSGGAHLVEPSTETHVGPCIETHMESHVETHAESHAETHTEFQAHVNEVVMGEDVNTVAVLGEEMGAADVMEADVYDLDHSHVNETQLKIEHGADGVII